MLLSIDQQDICNQRRCAALWFVVLPEVRGKPAFSATTVWLSAACADEARSVSDNPLLSSWVEVEARSRAASWHFLTISRIAAGVV
jgi:hypothetical protein